MDIIEDFQENYGTGWIKLYRSIKNHWLFPKGKPLTNLEAWLLILLEVNHSPRKIQLGYDIIECKRGESINSLDTWAKMFHWHKSKVRRFFKLLEKDSMIVLNVCQKTTYLTVCNYDTYQGERIKDETIVKRKRNDSETIVTPNKNDKNLNNEKNDKELLFKQSIFTFRNEYSEKMLNDFFEYWSEKNKSGTKMKFEMQKTWDLNRRLKRWASNDFNNTNGKINNSDKIVYEPKDRIQ
jgi:hypothetical protein